MAALLTGHAAFASPTAKLVFARGTNTDRCPDEGAFRAAVASRVGYDPFFPYAARTVVTRLDAGSDEHFRARMEILDGHGMLAGEKTFVSSDDDCAELVRTLALAVSLAIDVQEEEPASPAAPSTSAPETPVPAALPLPDAPAAEAAPAAPSKQVAPASLTGEAWGMARGSIGLAPSTSLGLALGAALRRQAWSIGVEGRYDPPASAAVSPNGRVGISLVAGTLLPCGSYRWFFGCFAATLGRIEAESDGVSNPESDGGIFAALGARVGAELDVASALAFRATLDVAATPTTHKVRIGVRDVYETNAVFGSFGLGAVVRF